MKEAFQNKEGKMKPQISEWVIYRVKQEKLKVTHYVKPN